MTTYRITIHCEADGLEWLEPIAKHLGHIEVAVDAPEPVIVVRQPHPAVEVIERAKEQQRKLERAKRSLDAERKERERARMARLSPLAIKAGPCPTCDAAQGQPCQSPDKRTDYGMTGHTHIARRELVKS